MKSWVNLTEEGGTSASVLTIRNLKEQIRRHQAVLKVGHLEEKMKARRELPMLEEELAQRISNGLTVTIREVVDPPHVPLTIPSPRAKSVEPEADGKNWQCLVEMCKKVNGPNRKQCHQCGQPRGVIPPGPM